MASRTFISACTAVALVLALWGCQMPAKGRPGTQQVRVGPVSEQLLRAELRDFSAQTAATTRGAANEIMAQSTDSVVIRQAIMWKITSLQATRRVIAKSDPRQALLDMWVLSERRLIYFSEGNGRSVFGALQPIAVDASKDIVRGVEGIAARLLPSDRFEEVRTAVEKYARANPFQGIAMEEVLEVAATPTPSLGPLGAVVSIPLAPFTAARGINQGAAAIRDFTAVADRLTDLVADLPEETRWQADLLLLDIEELRPAIAALENFTKATAAVSQLAATIREMPAAVEKSVGSVVKEVSANQAVVQKTLADARGVVAQVNTMLESTSPALLQAREASSNVADAGESWQGVIQAINTTFGPFGEKEPPSATPSRPFDIREYGDAAQRINDAAAQLTTLVAQARMTIESTQLDSRLNAITARVDAIAKDASANARGVVDRALWGLAALICLAFAAAVAYRVIAARMTRVRKTS